MTLNIKNEHMKILIKLLTLGVDVNVHDYAGFTPLHHCLTSVGNVVTFKMAERLIRAGADVNAKTRFGSTPLIDLVRTFYYDQIAMLLENGADPYIEDNDGISAFTLAQMNPKVREMFLKQYKRTVKEEKRIDGRNACAQCGAQDEKNKKCTGCYSVWYCGHACQGRHWNKHMDKCKETKSQYKLCTYRPFCTTTFFGMKGKVSAAPKENEKLHKTHFVVKVQVPKVPKGGSGTERLLIYNSDRTFCINLEIENNREVYSKLRKKIVSEGFKGMKGYFHVVLKPGDKQSDQFRINADDILPLEPW